MTLGSPNAIPVTCRQSWQWIHGQFGDVSQCGTTFRDWHRPHTTGTVSAMANQPAGRPGAAARRPG